MPQLASIPPLPSGGVKTVTPTTGGASINYPPEIQGVIVDKKDNPYGDQIIAESVQVRAVTLTSAQLLAVFGSGSDITIAEAPGAGYAILPLSVALRINYKTAYTLNSGTLKLYLGPSANAQPLTADLSGALTQTSTKDSLAIALIATGLVAQANAENQPLVASIGTASFTGGTSTLDMIVAYLVVQM